MARRGYAPGMTWIVACLGLSLMEAPGATQWTEGEGRLAPSAESQGFSMVLSSEEPVLVDVAEPNVPGAFGVGFDLHNPKETNPFNANGNIYDRPQREVSLHWNGVEIANRLSPVELRSPQGQLFRVRLEKVPGGSLASVWVGGRAVYDKEFVAFVDPIDASWRLAGQEGAVATRKGRPSGVAGSVLAHVFRDEVNDAGRHRFSSTTELPKDLARFARVVAVLKLGPTPKGLDPWDRIASLSVTDDRGRRFEVLRCITPYKKSWTWTADVTHLMPVLQGKRTFTWECETYGEGWLISFDLHYFEGKLSPRPVRIEPLWQATYEIGTGKAAPAPVALALLGLKRAEVYTTVTGHGMSPNTMNAAEFLPLWRRLGVNGHTYQNTLWKEDNYLNPCRPQGGTWKYDRAGWAPGSVVAPWRVDVTQQIKPQSHFTYEIEPYLNRTPVDGNPARHIIESVLVGWR